MSEEVSIDIEVRSQGKLSGSLTTHLKKTALVASVQHLNLVKKQVSGVTDKPVDDIILSARWSLEGSEQSVEVEEVPNVAASEFVGQHGVLLATVSPFYDLYKQHKLSSEEMVSQLASALQEMKARGSDLQEMQARVSALEETNIKQQAEIEALEETNIKQQAEIEDLQDTTMLLQETSSEFQLVVRRFLLDRVRKLIATAGGVPAKQAWSETYNDVVSREDFRKTLPLSDQALALTMKDKGSAQEAGDKAAHRVKKHHVKLAVDNVDEDEKGAWNELFNFVFDK